MNQLKELAAKNKLVTAIVVAIAVGISAFFFGIEQTLDFADDTLGDGDQATVEAPTEE